MKKHIVSILVLGLLACSLSACSKEPEKQEIKQIEASDAAESKEATERKYEDVNKESVVAPDRNSGNTLSDSEENVNTDENTGAVIERDPSIYGVWSADDGTNIAIFNSSYGTKFNMYDASSDQYISGDATTDGSTYIEVKYLKPVENTAPVVEEPIIGEDGQPVGEDGQPIEDNSINPYGSDEELYAALEQEREAQYETVKYSVDKMEYDQASSTMYLTLTGSGRTIELNMMITVDTPDYSLENNELANDMVIEEGEEEQKKEEIAE